MNHINIFFNTTISNVYNRKIDEPFIGYLGDLCLTPVRCLFRGDELLIGGLVDMLIFPKKDVQLSLDKLGSSMFKVIASIVMLLPALVIGGALKGFSYFSKSVRNNHRIAVTHYTPVKRIIIGSSEEKVDASEIHNKVFDIEKTHLNRTTNNLIIYVNEGTEMMGDQALSNLNPKKIIFVGAPKFLPTRLDTPSLEQQLPDNKAWDENIQRVAILEDAIADVPPRPSLLSKKLNRVYIVSEENYSSANPPVNAANSKNQNGIGAKIASVVDWIGNIEVPQSRFDVAKEGDYDVESEENKETHQSNTIQESKTGIGARIGAVVDWIGNLEVPPAYRVSYFDQ